jgi:hypothetical protein
MHVCGANHDDWRRRRHGPRTRTDTRRKRLPGERDLRGRFRKRGKLHVRHGPDMHWRHGVQCDGRLWLWKQRLGLYRRTSLLWRGLRGYPDQRQRLRRMWKRLCLGTGVRWRRLRLRDQRPDFLRRDLH